MRPASTTHSGQPSATDRAGRSVYPNDRDGGHVIRTRRGLAVVGALLALAGCGTPAHARTNRLAAPSPSPTATARAELPPSILARIPTFPPAPPPVPVTPPAGTSAGWYSAIATT